MIEEKTKEPQTAEPAQQSGQRRQKLRSMWAQLQCRGLLRRHRLRRKTQHHVNDLSQKLRQNPAVLIVGEMLYALGFSTEYAFVRAGRAVCRAALSLLHWGQAVLANTQAIAFPGAAQMFRDLFGPIILLFRGMVTLLVHAYRIRKQQGLGAAVRASGHYLADGVRRNIKMLPRMAMYILPAAALAAISHTVMDENSMADAILKMSSDEISQGTALYLDGELTAVCADGTALQSYLSSLLSPYEDPDNSNVTVGFNKEVVLENGIYFNESFQDYQTIEENLSGVQQQEKIYTVQAGDTLWGIAQKNDLTFRELCALNPSFKGATLTETSEIKQGDELIVTKQEAMLEVRITKVETWQEEIPYTTETTKSNEYASGTKKTVQNGEKGIRSVTAQRVYDTNGVQLSQQILSTEVVKEPVTEKIVEGTKKAVSNKTTYITGSGQFIWPVPKYSYCSRWYGSGHKGVDICAPAGTPIYASAGGTVTKAGYNKAGAGTGYGYSVIISHSGGYTTVYAHCISLVVSAGQTVRQGQLIGYVGSTGRSSGNHCHFEIRRNGSYISPQTVFNRSSYRNR